MAKKKTSFIFFIGDEGAIVSYIVGNHVEKKIFVSASDSDATETVRDLIKKDSKASIYILLDSLDQSYQTQSFPPVAKLSVQKLVNTKLKRDFSPSDITNSLPMGKEKDGRQDWKFLLISVVPSPQLMQWLDLILELDNTFKGIFLVPVEAENFIRSLTGKKKIGEDDAKWHMLVLHNKVSGFRQVITKNGRLTFTRLTQSSSSDNVPLVIAGNIEQEIVSTLEYLKRLSYREDEGIDITVISSGEIVAAIDSNKIGNHNEASFITPAQAAEKLSLPDEYNDNHFSDILFSAFLHNCKKPVLPFHTEASNNINKLQYQIAGVKYGSIAIAALIILGICYYAYAWFEDFSSEEKINNLIKQHKQEVSKLRSETKVLPDNIDKMQDAVSIYETFSKQDNIPLDFIKQLAEATNNGILIRNISWISQSSFEKRANKEKEIVRADVSIEFMKKFTNAEKRVAHINESLEAFTINFPEYTIEHSRITGTLEESGKLNVDFTNPESSNLASKPIVISLTFKTNISEDEAMR